MVTHYMPPHPGGIEHMAETLCAGYLQAGLDVRWIASRVPATAPAHEDHRTRVRGWNGLETMLGVPVPLWSPAGHRELQAAVRWADLVHVHDCLYPGSALAVAFAQRCGVPVVLTQHVGFVRYAAAPLNWLQRAAYTTLGRAVLRRASRLVFATPGAARFCAALLRGRPPGACDIANGIDISRFVPAGEEQRQAARRRLGVPADRPLVLFAGRLVEKKGIEIVLGVSERLPDLHFLIAGDGPRRALLQRARSNVAWRRAVPPGQMPDCYQAADVLLLPSRDEGLPLVVQEALASGCPAIVSEDEAFAAALVQAGVSAAVPRSDVACAAEVRRLVGGGTDGMRARARAYAAAHWDDREMVRRYLAVFEGLGMAVSRVGAVE
jgi:phosphatidylinositol alpha-mannosyltransferase/phosphatidylinositol alpha-1,6-mannosyltransferase